MAKELKSAMLSYLTSPLGMSRQLRMRVVLGFAMMVGAIGALGAGGTASAQYTFCNKTSYALSAAVGYVDAESLVTRGWWRLRAGECKRVLSDAVSAGRYYVYAEAIPGHRGDLRTWSGKTPLCVQNDSLFTLRDQDECGEDPRRQREFLPIDVADGGDGTWTTEFSDESNYTVFAAKVAGVQRLLRDISAYKGQIDGQLGKGTRDALRRYQRTKGLRDTGAINDAVIDALINDANTADSQLGFFFCNNTMLPIWSAFAQPLGDESDYRSSGWWRLESQECAKVRRGALKEESYYVYAVMEDEARSVPLAGGDTEFCVSSVQFDAEADVPCADIGYDSANFRRVDVDGEAAWTFQFTPELFNPDLAGR